jgi:hypothetical protein
MEIALYVLSAIGSAAVLLFFYISVRQVLDNSTEIDNIKQWNRRQGEAIDKTTDRFYGLQGRVEELEEVLSGRIADVIETKTRRRK